MSARWRKNAGGTSMADYKVQLNVFEGPLDLLLYLIKKEEVDIYEVNLTRIATQFIEYVEMMRRLDLDVAGEFLVMAATLMYIKSRELLPVDQQVTVEEDEDQIDPRWDLIRQLVEYKKFKDMAAQLHGRELEMDAVYGRQPGKIDLPEPEADPGKGVSLFDLIQAVSAILKRFQETEKPGVISEDKWTVSEKIQMLVEMIQSRTVVRFSELFASARSRSEVIATFLAMLELTRMKKTWLSQSDVFGEIEISAAPPPESMASEPVAVPETPGALNPPDDSEPGGVAESVDEIEPRDEVERAVEPESATEPKPAGELALAGEFEPADKIEPPEQTEQTGESELPDEIEPRGEAEPVDASATVVAPEPEIGVDAAAPDEGAIGEPVGEPQGTTIDTEPGAAQGLPIHEIAPDTNREGAAAEKAVGLALTKPPARADAGPEAIGQTPPPPVPVPTEAPTPGKAPAGEPSANPG
jgi:segregation and condensation protein A